MMLVMLLDLYFQLTPATMVAETPEVQAMARLMKIPVSLVLEVLEGYQQCDPYLNRRDDTVSPLLAPCHQVWTRYANDSDTRQLSAYANQLKDYFK